MENIYAATLIKLIKEGKSPSDALRVIISVLNKSGRKNLLPRVAKAFQRMALKERLTTQSVLCVARDADIANAKMSSGAANAQIKIDDSLIGGWKLIKGDTLIDTSFKKSLLEIYQRSVA